ncbi:MAG: hypothetical protein R3C03_07300 [Pirellulaceae bacterium]
MDQFHLDEPWNSEHNLSLIDQIPAVFVPPELEVELGMTNVQGVAGTA